MCLAMPAQVTELLGNDRATVNLGGVTKEVNTTLLEQIAIGDYVIIHVGYALTRLDRNEAEKTLLLFEEMLLETQQ